MDSVVLKISGEALAEEEQAGINLSNLFRIAQEIKISLTKHIQLGIVIGGGNIWRGARGKGLELERVISDNLGMLATVINAMALQNALEQIGVETRVMSAVDVSQVCERYIRRRAIRHMEKGRVVVFAAGTGNPFFSTDTAVTTCSTPAPP